jgi:magnesium chelatase family protein
VLNAWLQAPDIDRHCALDDRAESMLKAAFARLSLSSRAYHRILKVARSVADLDGATTVSAAHVGEAIGLRALDRVSPEGGSD